ncbi:MAG TPA: Imm74 family immunity protein [Candidatus Limnocylindrales bacterium]|nr:Imm74 family immunity protein [Candidatus Limnocylindrales bacterium]
MLTKWIRVLLGKKGPWAGIANRSAVIYWENGRKMTIAGEMLADGFEIYVASMVAWDDSNGELIDQSERQRILQNVKSSLESQGARVVLN